MKLFISWSGRRSKETARLLYNWLPQLINEIEPWMSDEDIQTGGDWSDAIKTRLNQSDFGIICVTPGNKSREWLLFEAGALSRQVGDSPARVAPFLIGFEEKSELRYPLARFQATEATRSDMRKLLLSMNTLTERPRTEKQIDDALEVYWPKFEDSFKTIRDSVRTQPSERRSEKDLLEEVLGLVRSLDKRLVDGTDPQVTLYQRALRARLRSQSVLSSLPSPRILSYQEALSPTSDARQALDVLADSRGLEITSIDFADGGMPRMFLADLAGDSDSAEARMRELHKAVTRQMGFEIPMKFEQ